MNETERELLQFLYDLHQQNISDVVTVEVAQHDDIIFEGTTDAPKSLTFGTARSLASSGHILMHSSGRDGYRFAITPLGRQLVDRGFQEIPEAPSGAQVVQFINSTVANPAWSQSGSASISNSPVTQNSSEIDKLLAQYIDVIQASDLPANAKQDAVAEIGQLGLEVRKPHPRSARVDDYLGSIRQITSGVTTGTGLFEVLQNAVRTIGIGG